ncbi:hypothetical protein SSP35_03_03280 [Streptomyces sp. NBRC 110611]|uniref:hypothetical protein n=1 Tax=Streptomyces sp. NBRC 110611 TaxID=1621259 RepID=UPI000855B846|nr:hypothetical protein [Streptomyces sp. NBRC 110611]GAU66680.1 hypothetical protein SSP35_03_03280 [Streptomyces sp. NBRC 110611]
MGIRLIVDVLDRAPRDLTHREARVLVALAEDANDETRTTWNSVECPEMLHRTCVSRSQMYVVLKSLTAKGALERVAAGQKNGAAKYRIPTFSAAPQRPEDRDADARSQSAGSRDTDCSQHPGNADTDTPAQRPGTQNTAPSQCPENRDASVPETGTPTPPNPSPTTPSASKQETPAADRHAYGIPQAARPLVDQLTAAGVIVRWPFQGDQWFPVLALIEKAGIPAMVDHAAKAAARADVASARYFLRGWSELPPLTTPGTSKPPNAISGGYQPFTCPPPSAYANDLGF